jgi:fructose-specific component phosphotransferase system IIB-like protein
MEAKMRIESMVHNRSRRAFPAVAMSALFVAMVAGCATVPAPTEQVAVSKAAIADAVSAGGGEYAPSDLRNAQVKIERAERAMGAQDYTLARSLAEEAEVDARLAATTARSVKAQRAVDEVYASIRALQDELSRKPL